MNDLNSIKNRVDEINRRKSSLNGKRQAISHERSRILSTTKKSQERIEIADMVKEVLERLQKKEQERAVGAYEELLSALLGDVLPGERHVVMDLHTERGGPALDVYIQKGKNAPLEDWLGTGGSVTNLLSTGLRLIALLRSGQRKFLILDESDCWLKPDLIPSYASIVKQMAKELGIQILMISHHDESLFSSHIPHRLKLEKQGSVLSALWSPTSHIPQWIDNQEGIRSLTLKNFQAHQNTVIPLSSEVTLLQGDNDIGKSSIVNAIRAVFDGDVNDTAIKHHATSAQVMIDFGPDNLLVWERWRKGKIKTSYKMINPNSGDTIYHTDGTKIPDWVKNEIKIGKVDGLDIQIGQQKDPVFLLNQAPSLRAKALSIGQESNYINAMMGHDKQETNEAKAKFKDGEKELERLRRHLLIFEKLENESIDENLTGKINLFIEKNEKIKLKNDILDKWKKQSLIVKINSEKMEDVYLPIIKSKKYSSILNIWKKEKTKHGLLTKTSSAKEIQIPKQTYTEYEKLLTKWNRCSCLIKLLHQNEFDFNTKKMNENMNKILLLNKTIKNALTVENKWIDTFNHINVLKDIDTMENIGVKQSKNTGKIKNILEQWENEKQNFTKIEKEIKTIITERDVLMKHIKTHNLTCPTCHRGLDEHEFNKTLANS